MQKQGNGLSSLRGSIAYGAFAKFAVMFVALVAMIATSLALTVGTAAAVEESASEGGVEEGIEPANIEGGGANLNGFLDSEWFGIIFEYNTSLNDEEPASAKNAIKFVVDVLDQDGNEIALPEGSIVPENISLEQQQSGVDAVVSKITIPGATYENSYFWWGGTYKGDKTAVSTFYNVQYTSRLYESYIAFTRPDAVGSDYYPFYPGYFAYNPTGTLHIVYRMNVIPELTVTDYYGSYDGQAHSGTVEVSAGVAEYSTDGVNWDTTAPTICDAGSATYSVRANYGGVYSDVQTLTLTVVPRDVTVNIQGKSETYTYDGKKHTVNGYEVTSYEVKAEEGEDPASIPSFDTDDVTLAEGVTAEVSGTDAGTYYMGLIADVFGCESGNFEASFEVEDGFLTIEPLRGVVLTIKGNSATHDYDGKEHSVEGYTAESSNPLFTESDWYFDGEALASGTEVGTYAMGLSADQFSVSSKNFADVTFDVTDGELEIVAADDDDADDDDADKDGSSKKHADKDDDSAADEASDGTPKTGDATNALLPAALMAGAAAAAMAARTRRREN